MDYFYLQVIHMQTNFVQGLKHKNCDKFSSE